MSKKELSFAEPYRDSEGDWIFETGYIYNKYDWAGKVGFVIRDTDDGEGAKKYPVVVQKSGSLRFASQEWRTRIASLPKNKEKAKKNQRAYYDKQAEIKKTRQETLQDAYSMSKLSDPSIHAALIDTLTEAALDGCKESMKILVNSGYLKTGVPVETKEEKKEEVISVDEAEKILKELSKD